MSITEGEIRKIAVEASKQEQKWLAPSLLLTFLVTLAGWAYSAGVVSTQVATNQDELTARRASVEAIPALKESVAENSETLKAMQATQNTIRVQQSVNTEILKRIEHKLNEVR